MKIRTIRDNEVMPNQACRWLRREAAAEGSQGQVPIEIGTPPLDRLTKIELRRPEGAQEIVSDLYFFAPLQGARFHYNRIPGVASRQVGTYPWLPSFTPSAWL